MPSGVIKYHPTVSDGFVRVPLAQANRLLERWGHYLGPCNRPYGSDCWVFVVADRPMAVAIAASIVSARVAGRYGRKEVVELARLCAASRWATRLMLRWWREVGALRWPYWPVKAAIAYSQSSRHEGDIYRFDGWTKFGDDHGSSGGGTWTKKRAASAAVSGKKRLWVYVYPEAA